MRVLIADPDWLFVRQARQYFEARGHHVVHESRSDEALERARRWKPDLVLLSVDVEEARPDGVLGALMDLQPRPAILLTASLERFDKAWRAWQRGGDEVLFKPLMHPSELHVAMVAAMENAVCPSRRKPGARAVPA